MADERDSLIELLQEQNAKMAATLGDLAQQVSELRAAMPVKEPEPLKAGDFLQFPHALYKFHGGKPGQIDHPDHDVMTVHSLQQLEDAIQDGWTIRPEYPAKAKRK